MLLGQVCFVVFLVELVLCRDTISFKLLQALYKCYLGAVDKVIYSLDLSMHLELAIAKFADETSFASLTLWVFSRFSDAFFVTRVAAEGTKDHLFGFRKSVVASWALLDLCMLPTGL